MAVTEKGVSVLRIRTASLRYTFDELGRIGIGKGKAKYELQEVSCNGRITYDSKSKTLKPFTTSVLELFPPFLKGGVRGDY